MSYYGFICLEVNVVVRIQYNLALTGFVQEFCVSIM